MKLIRYGACRGLAGKLPSLPREGKTKPVYSGIATQAAGRSVSLPMTWHLLLQLALMLGAATLFALALRPAGPPPDPDEWGNRNSW